MAMRKTVRRRSVAASNTEPTALPTLDAPIKGVVRGSALEYHINSARRGIAGWPQDVRAALGVSSPVPPPPASALPALDAPVEGVVAGSGLERQINLARRTTAAWPADVRAAMGIAE